MFFLKLYLFMIYLLLYLHCVLCEFLSSATGSTALWKELHMLRTSWAETLSLSHLLSSINLFNIPVGDVGGSLSLASCRKVSGFASLRGSSSEPNYELYLDNHLMYFESDLSGINSVNPLGLVL